MSPRRWSAVLAAIALLAGPAEARFGKAGSGTSSSGKSSSTSSSSSSSSSSSTSSSTRVSSPTSSSSGDYHAAAPARASAPAPSGWSVFAPRPVRAGYYSGAYVPSYGYGYCLRTTAVATTGVATTSTVEDTGTVVEESSGLRVTAGVEALFLTTGLSGFIFGGGATVEGDRWGLTLLGQNIAVRADDGSNAIDNIGVLTARVSFAFLSGKYGRLRGEAGVDTAIAPNLVAVGPVFGLSGSLWIYGPLALEGSAFVVPWPYLELDWRAGLVLGVGPLGIRAGWRTQMLDDRGWVDGVVHRDAFMGPYAGLSVAF